jgi:hypothetical protein
MADTEQDLEERLAKVRADKAANPERPRRTLGEILHELATTVGRSHLHEDIDALDDDKTVTDPVAVPGADDESIDKGEFGVKTTRIAPVGKEETENA